MNQVAPAHRTTAGEIDVRNVTKVYSAELGVAVTAVKDCSFIVERGKFTVLIGPSGCGKTTLIDLMAGYEAPTSGKILLDGAPITGPGQDRLVVFQESALFPWMTTMNNVMYGPLVQRERLVTSTPFSSRVACSGAPSSPAPSSTTPRSYSWTSRFAASTP
jgi:NitT/TauT family transport system ATP-binding protein